MRVAQASGSKTGAGASCQQQQFTAGKGKNKAQGNGVAGTFFEEARPGGIEEVHCKGEVSEKGLIIIYFT